MSNKIKIRQAVKKGYIEMESGGVADFAYPTSTLRRGRVQEHGWICPTITCSTNIHQVIRKCDKMKKFKYYIRRLTAYECCRLMGLKDEDVDKALALGVSISDIYQIAGNGIVTTCVSFLAEHLFAAQVDDSYIPYDIEEQLKTEN